jgi:hypothetical protein
MTTPKSLVANRQTSEKPSNMNDENNADALTLATTTATAPLSLHTIPAPTSTDSHPSPTDNQAMECEDCTGATSKKGAPTGAASPPKKSAAPASSCVASKHDKELERLKQRAARRHNHHRKRMGSPPPPVASLSSNGDDDAEQDDEDTKLRAKKVQILQRHIYHMEEEIQTAARMELALLNQSKALRDQRQKMTKRFEYLSKKMFIVQQRINKNSKKPAVASSTSARTSSTASMYRAMQQSRPLPPLFTPPSADRPRRVSASTKAETTRAVSKEAVLIDLSEKSI